MGLCKEDDWQKNLYRWQVLIFQTFALLVKALYMFSYRVDVYVTDETPSNCHKFLTKGGMQLFVSCLQVTLAVLPVCYLCTCNSCSPQLSLLFLLPVYRLVFQP